jgi:hypothetical protein
MSGRSQADTLCSDCWWIFCQNPHRCVGVQITSVTHSSVEVCRWFDNRLDPDSVVLSEFGTSSRRGTWTVSTMTLLNIWWNPNQRIFSALSAEIRSTSRGPRLTGVGGLMWGSMWVSMWCLSICDECSREMPQIEKRRGNGGSCVRCSICWLGSIGPSFVSVHVGISSTWLTDSCCTICTSLPHFFLKHLWLAQLCMPDKICSAYSMYDRLGPWKNINLHWNDVWEVRQHFVWGVHWTTKSKAVATTFEV